MAARVVVARVGGDAVRVLPGQRGEVAGAVRPAERLGRPRVVFSSSASVYAEAEGFEVFEDSPTDPSSPYARTKRMMEMVLQDLAAATDLRALILRYFNPIGADPELRHGIHVREPTHVLGQLVLAAQGRRDAFADHRHRLSDPGRHRAARLHPRLGPRPGPRARGRALRRGAGRGGGAQRRSSTWAPVAASRCASWSTSVAEVLGQPVPVREAPRRPGDVVGAYANVDRARELLGWTARSVAARRGRVGLRLGGEAPAGARVRVAHQSRAAGAPNSDRGWPRRKVAAQPDQ